mgnify:CR=1 FL=1
MKKIRVMGIDDGPFDFNDERVWVVGVIMRLPAYTEGVVTRRVMVDGRDATDKVISMIRSKFYPQLGAVILDGVALGGFNVVDAEAVYSETGVPLITVTRAMPDYDSMKRALMKYFDDWRWRWKVIERARVHEVDMFEGKIYVGLSSGITLDKAKEIIRNNTLRGNMPECLRLAHMIATAIIKGESGGKV